MKKALLGLIRRLLMKMTQTKAYHFFMKSILPYIRFTMYYPSFPGSQYHKASLLVRAGDIILCKDNRKLTTALIGGIYSHAGMCFVSNDSIIIVADFSHIDGQRRTFFDLCKESDDICILRCRDFDDQYIAQVVLRASDLIKSTPYDLSFELGVKALYCSEFIYEADFERRLQVSLEDLAGLGVPYISPTGLYLAKNVDIVYESAKNKR